MITTVSRRRHHDGFTLIELLVVVIILGILSGVVVFAVRGIGSKGSDEAIATDRRVIRTAEEAFCAKHGRYADEAELVEKKFLSDFSELHDVVATKDPPDPRPCNGWRYDITGGSGGTGPGSGPCLRLNNGVEEEIPGEPGQWCLAASPNGNVDVLGQNQMVQLPNGKVLAIMDLVDGLESQTVLARSSTMGRRTSLFDPAFGTKGRWTQGPDARMLGADQSDGVSDMLLLAGTRDAACPHCGKVLAHFSGNPGHWKLYDPSAGAGGQWSEISPASTIDRDRDEFGVGTPRTARAIQLLDDPATPQEECAPQCGKVLIVGGRPTIAELYDPRDNTFQVIGSYGKPTDATEPVNKNRYEFSTLAPLRDGRILMSVGHLNNNMVEARLFSPRTATFTIIAGPTLVRYGVDVRPVVLPDGGVLFQQKGSTAHVYRPEPPGTEPGSGAGVWETSPGCAADDSSFCHTIVRLPDGRALTYMNGSSFRTGSPDSSTSTRILTYMNSATRSWADGRDLNDFRSAGGPAVLLSKNPCGVNCNKVLTLGPGRAELYTP